MHKVLLSTDSSGEQESGAESRERSLSRRRSGPGAAGNEGTPKVAQDKYAEVRPIANKGRFKDMAWGEKYEGKYRFTDVGQADEEIEFMKEEVEQLKVDVEEYDSDLENINTEYRDAWYERKGLSEDIGRLQEDVKVQDRIMMTTKQESTRLEEKITVYKERISKYGTQIEHAQEARRKLMSERYYKRPLSECSPTVPREQSDTIDTNGRPSSSVSRMDNSMVQHVVGRMARKFKDGGTPPPLKAVKGEDEGLDPLGKYPTNCTLVIEGIPYHTNEHRYLREVPNLKVIAVNIPRDVNYESGEGGAYVNRGHVFMRFSERKYMGEVQIKIDTQDQFIECDVKRWVRHRIRCRVAERDIGSKDFFKESASILERARYFQEVFLCYSMN